MARSGLLKILSYSPSTVHNRGTIYLVEHLYSSSGKGNVPRTPSYSAHAEKQPFIYRHRRADAGSRHRRQHHDVQRSEWRSVAAAGLPQRLPHSAAKHLFSPGRPLHPSPHRTRLRRRPLRRICARDDELLLGRRDGRAAGRSRRIRGNVFRHTKLFRDIWSGSGAWSRLRKPGITGTRKRAAWRRCRPVLCPAQLQFGGSGSRPDAAHGSCRLPDRRRGSRKLSLPPRSAGLAGELRGSRETMGCKPRRL